MGDDDVLKTLVEMISAFFTAGTAVEEDLTYSLTSEFLRNIQDVLYTKQLVVFSRLELFFDINCETMLASREVYLRYVIYACLQINRDKTFEGFLWVFALILRSSIETRYRSNMNFCNLVPDVFMVFYKKKLKELFCTFGGFRQFVKYINNPKDLEKKCIVRNISDSYDPNASVSKISSDLRRKVFNMISGNEDLVKRFDFMGAENHKPSRTLAKKVLKTAKVKLSRKPSEDLNTSVSNLCPQKISQINKRPTFLDAIEDLIHSELTSEFCPKLCPDSKTYDDAVIEMADNTNYENIIETVIRYNQSKSLRHGKTKADRILEDLKCTIDSLIQVLDECDEFVF